jgi:transposase, IS5 family
MLPAPPKTEPVARPKVTSGQESNQWYCGIKVNIGVDKDSGPIHSVETTSANVHVINRAAQPLRSEEEVVYGDEGYQGNDKRPKISDKRITFVVAMRPVKRRVLPITQDGQLQDLIETTKIHIRAKVKHPFRIIK